MSGVPFCSHDVGGFDYSPQAFDQESPEDYPKDGVAYVRWLQFGVFSSHIRAHGKQPREPWSYGPAVESIARRYLKLRYRLLPYIYSEAVKATHTGLPMVRPLVLEYPEDPNTYHLDWQYLFGDGFLVAPVVSPDNRVRVYLPAGAWVDYWTRERLAGGRWLTVEAPLDILPLWVRAGAIMPLGPELAFVEEKPLDPLTLALFYPQSAGETVIYDEDKPAIEVRYARRGKELAVEVDPAPGRVEIVLVGARAAAAGRAGQPLALADSPEGQRVSFEGTTGSTVTFLLEE